MSGFGGIDPSGGGGGGGGGPQPNPIMNLLMLNPRVRQMVQAGQQQQQFAQQERVKRMLGQAYLQMAGNQGAGTPTPGMMGDQGGGSPPSMQGPQGGQGIGPPQPPGLPPPPGQASSPSTQRIGLNGKPVGPNPTVGDETDTMAQRQPMVPRGGMGAGPIGASFDPRQGNTGGTYMSRADRNNNPGNIEAGSFTRSQPGAIGSDSRFARFDTWRHGAEAQQNLLRKYASGGRDTMASIINKWSPPSDPTNAPGSTSAYIRRAAALAGVDPNEHLNLNDPKVATRVAGAMAEVESGRKGTAVNYVNRFNSGVDGDPTAQKLIGSTPEGSLALNQGMAKQLDWRTLVRAIMATSPNARPEDVAEAVNGALPVMSQDSQNQWKQINAQLAAGRLQVSQQGEQDRTRLGDERNDIARQRLADQRANAKDRIDIAKQNLQVSKDRLQFFRDKEKTATDFKTRQAAAQAARDEEKKQHDLQTAYTGALNAYSNLARSGVDMAPETPPGEGIFGGAGHKEAPEAAAARENIARTRSGLNPGGALTKSRAAPPPQQQSSIAPNKGSGLVKKPIPPDQLAIAKQVLQSGSPEDIAAMKKELEDAGYDTSALGV